MSIAHSPLRYPGGKQVLARVLSHLLRLNNLTGGTYAEPYAGGGGAALWLLFNEYIDRILINDRDPGVYLFWRSILHETDAFLDLLNSTKPTPDEWQRQRDIYLAPRHHAKLRVGFAAFFLNRCNRSGIISRGGMIGGKKQTGKWKIDARYNKVELAKRIRKISLFKDRISLSNEDALVFIRHLDSNEAVASRTFVYLDPPYYHKGSSLYLNFYGHEEHVLVAAEMRKPHTFKWVMTYDNVPEIQRMYKTLRMVSFDLDYSAENGRIGKEVLIYPRGLRFPARWTKRIPPRYITAADGVAIPMEG